MARKPIDIAVVGHTNTGKTTLMRTLTRQRYFGEVSARPATTRHVEAAELSVGGETVLRLFDTPGLEDSSGLLAYLDRLRGEIGGDWTDAIDALITRTDLQGDYGQEAKVLAQLRRSDVALYVIDSRDLVRGRHRDELEILGRTAIPVLPVLNFVADPDARPDDWRDQLARANMHAVIAFDTVVFDEAGEQALYQKIATLADRFAPAIRRMTDDLALRRRQLRRASTRVIADLLIDAAAARRAYQTNIPNAEATAAEDLQAVVRDREEKCLKRLLALHGFDPDDARLDALSVHHGRWDDDLFDPATLANYGVSLGTSAATGAAAGVAIDVMVGGMTLGAAAASGAAIGFLADVASRHGGRLKARISGIGHVRIDDATLALLAVRQARLVSALMARGHGAVKPVASAMDATNRGDHATAKEGGRRIARRAARARSEPEWSVLNGNRDRPAASVRRDALGDDLATRIDDLIR